MEPGACKETAKIKELILRQVYKELMATENRKKAKKLKKNRDAKFERDITMTNLEPGD